MRTEPGIGAASAEHPADALSEDDLAAEQEGTVIEAAAKLGISEGDRTSI